MKLKLKLGAVICFCLYNTLNYAFGMNPGCVDVNRDKIKLKNAIVNKGTIMYLTDKSKSIARRYIFNGDFGDSNYIDLEDDRLLSDNEYKRTIGTLAESYDLNKSSTLGQFLERYKKIFDLLNSCSKDSPDPEHYSYKFYSYIIPTAKNPEDKELSELSYGKIDSDHNATGKYGFLQGNKGAIPDNVIDTAMDLVMRSLSGQFGEKKVVDGYEVNWGARVLSRMKELSDNKEKGEFADRIKNIIKGQETLNAFCLLAFFSHKDVLNKLYIDNMEKNVYKMPYAENNITLGEFYDLFDTLYDKNGNNGRGVSIENIIKWYVRSENNGKLDDSKVKEIKEKVRQDICWYVKYYRLLTLFGNANELFGERWKNCEGKPKNDPNAKSSENKPTQPRNTNGNIPHAPGFVNIGNSCYFNTALQCMYASKKIRRLFEEYRGDESTVKAVRDFFTGLRGGVEAVGAEKMKDLFKDTAFVLDCKRGLFWKYDKNGKELESSSRRRWSIIEGDATDFAREYCDKVFRNSISSFYYPDNANMLDVDYKPVPLNSDEFKTAVSSKEVLLFDNQGEPVEGESGYMPSTITDLKEELKIDADNYKIVSVAMHTGNHYYAYIRGDDDKWYLQNDNDSIEMRENFSIVNVINGSLRPRGDAEGGPRFIIYEKVEEPNGGGQTPKSQKEQLNKGNKKKGNNSPEKDKEKQSKGSQFKKEQETGPNTNPSDQEASTEYGRFFVARDCSTFMLLENLNGRGLDMSMALLTPSLILQTKVMGSAAMEKYIFVNFAVQCLFSLLKEENKISDENSSQGQGGNLLQNALREISSIIAEGRGNLKNDRLKKLFTAKNEIAQTLIGASSFRDVLNSCIDNYCDDWLSSICYVIAKKEPKGFKEEAVSLKKLFRDQVLEYISGACDGNISKGVFVVGNDDDANIMDFVKEKNSDLGGLYKISIQNATASGRNNIPYKNFEYVLRFLLARSLDSNILYSIINIGKYWYIIQYDKSTMSVSCYQNDEFFKCIETLEKVCNDQSKKFSDLKIDMLVYRLDHVGNPQSENGKTKSARKPNFDGFEF